MAKDDRPRSETAELTRRQFSAMLRGSVIATTLMGLVAVAVAAVVGDARDAWSAALGAAVVILFFSLSLLVMRQTAHLEPMAVMAVVLATYTGKILALGIVMVVLRDASWLSGQALALSIICCTVVWLALEMRAFTRMRVLVAPGADAPDVTEGAPDDVPGAAQAAPQDAPGAPRSGEPS